MEKHSSVFLLHETGPKHEQTATTRLPDPQLYLIAIRVRPPCQISYSPLTCVYLKEERFSCVFC